MARTPRAVQTPGEPVTPAEADAMDETAGAVLLDVAPAAGEFVNDETEALKAKIAALEAENAALAKKAKAGPKPTDVVETVAGGHKLTNSGWLVKEPPAQPVRG